MPFELESFAKQHFAQQTHLSLVAAIQQTLDIESLLDVLGSGRWQLQFLAARRLQQLARERDIQPVLQSGLRKTETCGAMLAAMSYLSLEYDRETLELLCEQLDHENPEIREAAVKVVVFQRPELIDSELVVRFDRPDAIRIARSLCFSGRVDLIPQVTELLGFPDRRLPPSIGLLVTPEWLSQNLELNPKLVENLAEECGYLEGIAIEAAAEFWGKGFMFVGPEIDSSDKPSHELRKRIFEICYRLLPFDLEMNHRSAFEFDATRPLDSELFLAALREADRANLEQMKQQSPFDYRCRASPRIVTCSHASVRFVREEFVELAARLAQELDVPNQLWSTFLIEHGRVGLEIDDERRTEAELYLRSRWRTISRNASDSLFVPPITFPVNQFDDFPWGVNDCSGRPPVSWKDDPQLTAGANAVCRMAESLGRHELVEWVQEKESFWRGRVPPIGCELQIPLGDPNVSLLKKQTLRGLGIPSPRRPEYRGMVEAAFRPAASWHAMLLGPMLLHELGIIDRPQEMALHISIQGAIGDQIRYLATCASFIHTGRRKRPHRALTRVMSKGLVCRNSEIEQCVSELPAQSRTEIRLHRCFAETDENDRVSLDMSYIDDILATHLLATAAMSPERDLAELYVAFGDAVANAIGQLPPEFAEYLTSDFYQSTGDPHDPELLDVVPIVRKFKEIREIVKRDGLRAELEQTFLTIRDASVWRILKVLTGSKAAALKEWDPDRSPHSNLWA